MSFAGAARRGGGGDGRRETRRITGHLPPGAPDFVHLPVDVPPGIRELAVSYTYDRPPVPDGTPGNACDIGIFDERGADPGGAGFRGWSGGARTAFFLRADDATPGYLPGPLNPGTWQIALGPYTIAPQGLRYEVTVTLTYGAPGRTPSPAYPPPRARGRGRAWYRGDSHLHTVHSDGTYTPEEIAALARAAGLDFLTTTEHNTTSAHGAWHRLWGDDLLILTGEEITTRNGHVLAMGTDPGTFVDWRYRARDGVFPHYARAVRQAGGLVVPAHPYAPCLGCGWKFGLAEADALEVWNGPYTPDDEAAVAAWDATLVAHARDRAPGWLPAVGNSDAHRPPDTVGHPQTVVLADDLSRDALHAGLRAGHAWIAESAAVGLAFTATGPRGESAIIGDRLAVPRTATVMARLTVSGAAGCTARLITDQGVLHTAPVPATGRAAFAWRTTPERAAYLRAELRHPPAASGGPALPGPPAALTNPIFLGP